MEVFVDFTGRRLNRVIYESADLDAAVDEENLASSCNDQILRENPFFYCQPCRSLIKSCRALLLHANSNSHKKVTFCWRRCLDLLSEGIVEDAEGTQSIIDETKKSPLRGLNDIVLIRDPNTKQIRHWVCTLCFTFGSADHLLIQHLASLDHIDRIAELVVPELNKPSSPSAELFSKRHFEFKMLDKEMLLKRKTQPGVFRSYQSPWLQDWEFDSQRENEEKAFAKSFLVDFMTNPQEFSLSFENVATKNSILALECKALQLKQSQDYVGTEYLVEIWLPRGKLIPLFYCCLCNKLINDWKKHAVSKMHKGIHDIVKEMLENKSELWSDKNPIVASVVRLEMSPFDCFLPIRAVNFLCGVEKSAPQLWELIKSVKSSFRMNPKADEIKSAAICSEEECPKTENSRPKNRPEPVSPAPAPVFKAPLPPAKTSPSSSSSSSSLQLDDVSATSIPPLPRAPGFVSQTNFNQLMDRANLFYDLLVKQAKTIEHNNRIIAYFNLLNRRSTKSKFDDVEPLAKDRLSDESTANKQRLAGFGAEFDPFFEPFQLNSLPLHFKNHVLKVVEWFDSYATQVLMPMERRGLQAGGGDAADVAVARLRDWMVAYPDDRPTVEKAIRVLITILSARLQSFYGPVDEAWCQKTSFHLDFVTDRIFKNQDIIMKRIQQKEKCGEAAPQYGKDGRRLNEKRPSGPISESNRPNQTMKNGSVDFSFKLSPAESGQETSVVQMTTKKRRIMEPADGERMKFGKRDDDDESSAEELEVVDAVYDDDFNGDPSSSVGESKAKKVTRKRSRASAKRRRRNAAALGLSVAQFKNLKHYGVSYDPAQSRLPTTDEIVRRITAAREDGKESPDEPEPEPDRNWAVVERPRVLEALKWAKKWREKTNDCATDRFSRLEARQALKWAEQLKTKNAISKELQQEIDIITENIRQKLSQVATRPSPSLRRKAPCTPLPKSTRKAAACKKLKWAARFFNKLPGSNVAAEARKISRKKEKCGRYVIKKLRTKSNGPTKVCPKIKLEHSERNSSSALKKSAGDDDECCIVYEANMESEEETDVPLLPNLKFNEF